MIRKKSIRVAETVLKDITNMFIERGPWNWNVLVIAAVNRRHKFPLRERDPDKLMKRLADVTANR